MARTWKWIKESSVLAIHEEQIAEHGGLAGVRDLALLQSALARPQNLEAYGQPDAADLAAAYAAGIARNHPFLDGNKRTAWVVAEAFLLKNGFELLASDHDSLLVMLSVADGSMPEKDFAAWLRAHLQPYTAGR
jgi:death on curing protein